MLDNNINIYVVPAFYIGRRADQEMIKPYSLSFNLLGVTINLHFYFSIEDLTKAVGQEKLWNAQALIIRQNGKILIKTPIDEFYSKPKQDDNDCVFRINVSEYNNNFNFSNKGKVVAIWDCEVDIPGLTKFKES
uniref:Uncharacterized protein n=1 Tax=Rhizophagus irregularis (strain DAOM 181602 / DAOM 197198 / MUCL 43194) TaxID=747089 RepID=U9SZ20_RHIID